MAVWGLAAFSPGLASAPHTVSQGHAHLEMAPKDIPEPAPVVMDMAARQVVIQHADTVNVYTTGEA